ncbi:MAG: NUDIX hydrolase [bacterium]|nr:NUDIX hydrolase [bacterium]
MITTGVGLLLFNQEGKIMVVRELRDKPVILKRAGMLSFPLETWKPQIDRDFSDTLRRLMEEELGGEFPCEDLRLFGVWSVIPLTVTIVFTARYCGRTDAKFTSKDSDVEVVGWVSPPDLLQNSVRREVAPVMDELLARRSRPESNACLR